MSVLGIIPSRYSSTRFPGKPLIDIGGKTMIQRVYLQAAKAKSIDQVVVATDDKRIHQHVQSFGGQSIMTSSTHQSGTDRCAEVATRFQDMDTILNIQGDEPFIAPEQIDLVASKLIQNRKLSIATLAKKIRSTEVLFNPNVVKVVFSNTKIAHYFSRQPIPYLRGITQAHWLENGDFYKHIGLYGYRRNTLLELAKLPKGRLEIAESLEQLRWLENGYVIGINLTDIDTIGIDTPADLEAIVKKFNSLVHK